MKRVGYTNQFSTDLPGDLRQLVIKRTGLLNSLLYEAAITLLAEFW